MLNVIMVSVVAPNENDQKASDTENCTSLSQQSHVSDGPFVTLTGSRGAKTKYCFNFYLSFRPNI
jgi:hypothetical protein